MGRADEIGPEESNRAWRRAQEFVRCERDLRKTRERLGEKVRSSFAKCRAQAVHAELRRIPVTGLRSKTLKPLNVAYLERARYRTVYDVYISTPTDLQRIRGIGPSNANRAVRAARKIAAEVGARITPAELLAGSASRPEVLLVPLQRLISFDEVSSEVRVTAGECAARFEPLVASGNRTSGFLQRLFSGSSAQAEAKRDMSRLAKL